MGEDKPQASESASPDAMDVQAMHKDAHDGDLDAQYELAWMYRNGDGVEVDQAEAVRWFRAAAEQNDIESQKTLAFLFQHGDGVTKDMGEAVHWYREAAHNDDAEAKRTLGWLYHLGDGVERDQKRAVDWFRRAAVQNDSAAQCALGWMYQTGQGTEENPEQARDWYGKAAAQGFEPARKALDEVGGGAAVPNPFSDGSPDTGHMIFSTMEPRARAASPSPALEAHAVTETPGFAWTRAGLFALAAILAYAGFRYYQSGSLPGSGPTDVTQSETFRDCDICPHMVELPAGRFEMGGGQPQEQPVHTVTIEKPFAIGIHEVTFEEYDRFVADTGYESPNDQGWGRGRRPVIGVSWTDAVAYTEWLSKTTDKSYRLPTEAEWAYAAHAGTTTAYWWGQIVSNGEASCRGCQKKGVPEGTMLVGSFKPNPFGIYDTVGNVWEWTQDCWNGNFNEAPTDGSAWRSGDCKRAVIRGGAWSSRPDATRSASRDRSDRNTGRYDFLGFRVARDT